MTSLPDGLRLTLDVPSEARRDIPVPIALRIENIGDRLLELTLRGRSIAFDVIVRDANGRIIWRRLANTMIPAIARLEQIEPRQALELHADWRTSGSPPGDYLVEAELFTDGAPLRPPSATVRLIAE
jgi:hypothetical protein